MESRRKSKLAHRGTVLAGPILAVSMLFIVGCTRKGPNLYQEIIGHALPTNTLVNISTVSRFRESEHSVLIRFPTSEAAQRFVQSSKMKDVEGDGLRSEMRLQLDAAVERMTAIEKPGLTLPFERIVVGQSANAAFSIFAGVNSNYVFGIVK